ncbi:MAG: cyclase family protein [Planctomycetota bacterium]|jgi:kynurenine formamidase
MQLRAILFFVSVLLIPVSCRMVEKDLGKRSWVDLSYEFSPETIYWPNASGFRFQVDSKGMNENGYWYEANSFAAAEHGGTHLDAPVHFAEGAWTSDAIPIEKLVGPAVVVDISEKAAGNRDYQMRVVDLQDWERKHGRIPKGAILLVHTGFGRYWPDREKYLGSAELGQAATLKLHFPGVHPSAAKWLVENRAIDAIGIDTASIDHGASRLFHSHRELYKANIPGFENLANLDQLPAKGATVIALPMKIKDGSGGPLRIVAFY